MSLLAHEKTVLRDYQQECLDKTWDELFNSQRILNVLPCGAGKTVIFEHLILKTVQLKPDIKIVVLFNRVDLLNQIYERVSKTINNVGIYCASLKRFDSNNILIASVHSLPPGDYFNLVIVDECHNINERDGKYKKFIESSIATNQKLKIVGFTATPYRNDGYIFGDKKFWPKINYTKSLLYFIENKYLVEPICKSPDYTFDTSKLRITAGEYNQADIDKLASDKEYLREQVIDALNRSIGRKKTVWFCSNIEHAENVEKELRSFGEWAVTVHSNLDRDERDESLDLFMTNDEVKHLTFVSIVSEGFDYPPIDCVVLLRPTRSAALYVQTCGRGLRLYGEKENCLILDYAQVVKELGPLTNPLVVRKEKGKSKNKKEQELQKVCPDCRTYNHPRSKTCKECSYEFPITVKGNLFADESADLLGRGDKILTLDVTHITVSEYVSKAGNPCIKISYYTNDILKQPVSEFFAYKTTKGLKNLQIRSAELMIENLKATKIPKSITYVMDNGYPKIKTLVWEK